MKEITERAQRVAAEIFPRDDEQAKAAAMLIGRELQLIAADRTICTGCGHDASPLPPGALACCPDSNHRTAAELLAELEQYKTLAGKAICGYCGVTVPKTAEAMAAHHEECTSDQQPVRQLKLERGRLEILMAALSELKQEFDLVPKRNHWALMRIRIAFRDVDELKL